MNLFLTGPRQIGKSTALSRALTGLPFRTGGVVTRFEDRNAAERRLGLFAPGETPVFDEPHICARFLPGRRPEVFPAVFDGLGAQLLRRAAEDPETDWILIDELGFLEAGAPEFLRAVRGVLTGPKPVLGVVREGLGAYADAPFEQIITVTGENRNSVPAQIRAALAAAGLLPEGLPVPAIPAINETTGGTRS